MVRIKIGLIGCGLWGRNILRDLILLGADVVVVDSAAEVRASALQSQARAAVATLAELEDVAGIVVATPATTHAEIIGKALDRGVPVFAEKPLTTDVAEAARLVERAPRQLFVMHVWRYHRGIELLADIARAEELGPVYLLRTTRVSWTSPRRDTDSIWTLAPHDLSIALAILGTLPTPRAAAAEHLGDSVVGLVGILGDNPLVVLEVSSRYRDKRREVRLHCRDGVAVLPDGEADYVEISRISPADPVGFPVVEKRSFISESPLLRELRSFLEFLQGGPPPRSSAAEGLAVVSAISQLRSLAGI